MLLLHVGLYSTRYSITSIPSVFAITRSLIRVVMVSESFLTSLHESNAKRGSFCNFTLFVTAFVFIER